MTGLNIGDVYYFLVDGCSGSHCDVTIDVVGVCGNEFIAPWTQPVTGPTSTCAGNSFNYSVEDLVGAAQYHWFVDGTLQQITTNNTANISWPNSGTFDLCIDASNDPCVPITDPPAQLCTTVNVFDSEAGAITATPMTACPGESINFSVTGYDMSSSNEQAILITDPSGVVVDVINSSSGLSLIHISEPTRPY